MAINYLNSIDLNRNELQNAQLIKAQVENQPNNASAGTGLEGQLYYDTTLDVLKVWSAGSWSEVGGGVETITTTDGTYIDLTPDSATAGAVTVTADLSAIDGTSVAASRFLTKDNTWATVPQGDITGLTEGTYIGIDNPDGPIPTINHDLTTRTDTTSTDAPAYGATFEAVTSVTTNTTGHITAIDVSTVTIPAAEAYTFDVTGDSGTDQTIGSGDTLDIAGGTNISTVVGATDTVTVNLDDSISLLGSLTVGTTGDFTGQVTIPQVPVSDTDAASKHYVDQAVTGALSYQGAYDAATNTPDLDSSPSSTIKTGWTYTVTVEGLFFTEQVRVGDVLIANNNAPTTLAEWTTVQNNIDLADATTVGIGNVVPGSSNTITAPYTSGTATLDVVDSTASQKGAVIVSGGTGVDVAYTSGTATVSLTAVAARSGSIAVATSTTYTYPNSITAGATNNVLIQLVDSTTGETVHADVTRLTTTTFSVDYGVAEPTGVVALIQLIG